MPHASCHGVSRETPGIHDSTFFRNMPVSTGPFPQWPGKLLAVPRASSSLQLMLQADAALCDHNCWSIARTAQQQSGTCCELWMKMLVQAVCGLFPLMLCLMPQQNWQNVSGKHQLSLTFLCFCPKWDGFVSMPRAAQIGSIKHFDVSFGSKANIFSILTGSKTKLNPQCQHIFICVWEPTSLFIKVPTPRAFDCLTVWLSLPILWSQLPSVFASSHQRHWLPSTHKWKHDLRWKVAFGSHAQASNQNNPASTNEERTKFKKKSLTTFKEGMKHWILKQERPQPDTLSKRSQLQRKSFCEFSRSWLWSGSWSWLGLGLGCISWSKQASETTKRWLWQAVQVIFQQQLLHIKHLAFCQWKWGFDNFINPLTFFGPTLMNKCSPVSPNWKFAAWQRHSLWTTKIETLFAFVCHGCQCWPKHCVFGTIVLVGTCHKQQTDCLFQILSSSSTPNDPCFLDKILTLCWQKKNGTMSTTCHLLNTTFLVTEARLDLQVTQLFPSMLNDLAWTRDGAFVFTTS